MFRKYVAVLAAVVGFGAPTSVANADLDMTGWSCHLDVAGFSPSEGASADGTATCLDPSTQSVVAHAVHMTVEASTGSSCYWTVQGTITLDAPTGTYRGGYQLTALVETGALTIDNGASGIVAFAADRLTRRCLTADPGYEVTSFSGAFVAP
jgi:hypothetical protein